MQSWMVISESSIHIPTEPFEVVDELANLPIVESFIYTNLRASSSESEAKLLLVMFA